MENVERDGSPTVLLPTTLRQPATPGEALRQEQTWCVWNIERNPERPGPREGGSLGKMEEEQAASRRFSPGTIRSLDLMSLKEANRGF